MASVPLYTLGDTANAVLNTARSRIDDLIQTPAGSPTGADPGQQLTQVGGMALLAELNPDGSLCLRTQIIFNSAWRKMQKYLANLGYRQLTGNQIVAGLPANVNADPGSNTWLSWNGCFNGTTLLSTPFLPTDLYAPLKIRERATGTNPFQPMTKCLDGLFNISTRTAFNRFWEWRNNALYFLGATAITDLQVTYVKFLPDLILNLYVTGPWYYQPLPIPGCLSALAWYIAYEVCVPRIGEQNSAGILLNAQDEADKIFNDQARSDQRTPTVKDGYPRPGVAPAKAPQQA